MKYEKMKVGKFIERPNRFIALVEIDGIVETVHVKNTGRCKELLIPGATVYVQRAEQPQRKTKWDLIGVEKGTRLINMDSQVTNHIVKEWIEKGNLFPNATLIKTEKTYGNSRFDLYVEVDNRKIFIEIKGVTLEDEEIVRFPDAPTLRGVKHVEELCNAIKEGYEAIIFFVIQMNGVKYFAPNDETHQDFGDALRKAEKAGVKIMAYDCQVGFDYIAIQDEVKVVLEHEELYPIVEPLVEWYRENKRQLPWREHINAYRVWVSEIMLQQTRVEAVKPFYKRFLEELPEIKDLASAKEDDLLKLWEGLGYYNRVRNMQKAAQQIMNEFDGEFPRNYEEILTLTGIGSYTAGAISAFAFDIPKPAVDGNVMRVISRFLASDEDIMKQSVRKNIENALEAIMPKDHASDFNQGLIELGAIVCLPNGLPKCEQCPLALWCQAKAQKRTLELPIKKKAASRKIEKRTVFIFKDGESIAIKKRPTKGLLAGLYELPNIEGHLTLDEAVAYSKSIGLVPIRVKELAATKHIFSHIEWHMVGYVIRVDELEKASKEKMLFIHPQDIEKAYPIPAAFQMYTDYINIKLGQEKYEI